MRRVVRPGGRIAVVTWTQPEAYELAGELRTAISAICPNLPSSPLPAQLRYRERDDFHGLFLAAGLADVEINVVVASLRAPCARWLGERIGFAPGMAALLAGLGADTQSVIDRFVKNLEVKHGTGKVLLSGKAFIGVAEVA